MYYIFLKNNFNLFITILKLFAKLTKFLNYLNHHLSIKNYKFVLIF